MKNLQFRLWDKKRKEMINLRSAELSDTQGAHIALAFEEYGHTRSDETESIEDYEVLQFTGLLDKNGKEIFEGDIVKRMQEDFSETNDWKDDDPRWNDNLPLKEVMRDVVTMERFPVYWLKNEGFGYEGEDLVSPDDCEKIGTIYENPELLNK